MLWFSRWLIMLGLCGAIGTMAFEAGAQYHGPRGMGPMHMRMHGDPNIVFGAPANPSTTWSISKGGQLYDKWWAALGLPPPAGTHPAYPATGKQRGSDTWRCKECHGWDYKGKSGKYATGSHATGIIGIDGARGRAPEDIVKILRNKTHRLTRAMIGDSDLNRLALFVARGQHDTDKFIDAATGTVKIEGMTRLQMLARGRAIYQTTCAACHGFDGRTIDFGDRYEPAFVGTEANKNPWEVLHKIRNAHPGVAMISLRAFAIRGAAAVLAHTRTLPKR
jgi:thiosulfate dehydrogenase